MEERIIKQMKVIKASIKVEKINGTEMLQKIEVAGRTCYKSEDKITTDSAEKFVKNIIAREHESVLEHEKISVRIICDRGVSHELVRHRIASYSQESTRYVNYKNKDMEFIKPIFWDTNSFKFTVWSNAMKQCERVYKQFIENGATPQEARSVLPNSLKTEVVTTMNLRAWRHFLKLRCAPAAHPQMREVANLILTEFNEILPSVFGDILKWKERFA